MASWHANSPTASRLVGSGCIECPSGSAVKADQGLGALETLSKNILELKDRRFDGPDFPLSEMPTSVADTNLLGGDDYTVRYDYHIPNLHDILMHNPEQGRETATRITNAINDGGPEALTSSLFDMSSIFCNPPRGRTGVMGKDVTPITSAAVPLEMGPFCMTQFQNFDHLASSFSAMQREYPNALMQILNYQKIRDFIAGNHNLASAVAGHRSPRFNKYSFADRPNSVGSIEWFSEAIDHITAFAENQSSFTVCMSRRTFRRWMKDYAKKNGVTLNVDFANLNQQVGDYYVMTNEQGAVKMVSDRRNISYTIDFSKTPVYVTDNQVGTDAYEWGFQPYFETRAGDDTRSGEAAGFVRDVNAKYGKACRSCPDGMKSLSELILIYNGESHKYEAFPENPASNIPELAELDASVKAIVGSMNMKLYFGAEVQTYFLDPLYKVAGTQCPLNIDNTWFAGRIWAAFRNRWLNQRACGALLVKVPNDADALTEEAECLMEEYGDAITLTAREPQSGGRECSTVDESPADPAGYLRPDCDFEVTRDDEDQTIQVTVERLDGVAGTLTVAYETEDGTAEAATDYTAIASTNLVFAEGQTQGYVEVVILGGDAVNPEDKSFKRFKLLWSGAGLGEGVCEETIIDIHDQTDEDVPVAT